MLTFIQKQKRKQQNREEKHKVNSVQHEVTLLCSCSDHLLYTSTTSQLSIVQLPVACS